MAMFDRADDCKVNESFATVVFFPASADWKKPSTLSLSAPLTSSSTGQSFSTTWGWLVGVMLFSFCFSIDLPNGVCRTLYVQWRRPSVCFSFSLSTFFSLVRGAWRRRLSLSLVRRATYIAGRFCLSICYFLLFLFSFSLSLFLSSLARKRDSDI